MISKEVLQANKIHNFVQVLTNIQKDIDTIYTLRILIKKDEDRIKGQERILNQKFNSEIDIKIKALKYKVIKMQQDIEDIKTRIKMQVLSLDGLGAEVYAIAKLNYNEEVMGENYDTSPYEYIMKEIVGTTKDCKYEKRNSVLYSSMLNLGQSEISESSVLSSVRRAINDRCTIAIANMDWMFGKLYQLENPEIKNIIHEVVLLRNNPTNKSEKCQDIRDDEFEEKYWNCYRSYLYQLENKIQSQRRVSSSEPEGMGM